MAYKFNRRAMLERAIISELEVKRRGLIPKDVRCPYCKHKAFVLYYNPNSPSERGSYVEQKCDKCKREVIYDLYLEQFNEEKDCL